MAPNWPPPELIADGWPEALATALGPALAMAAASYATAGVAGGRLGRARLFLLLAAFGQGIAIVALVLQVLARLPDPTSHAYAASSAMLAAYAATHAALALV